MSDRHCAHLPGHRLEHVQGYFWLPGYQIEELGTGKDQNFCCIKGFDGGNPGRISNSRQLTKNFSGTECIQGYLSPFLSYPGKP